MDSMSSEVSIIMFKTKFQGKSLELPLDTTCRVGDLKRLLQDETSVPVSRQKLIGLVKGKLPPDETLLKSLVSIGTNKAPPYKFTLMGTPDDKLFVDPSDRDDLPEVLDDFKAVFGPPALLVCRRPVKENL